MHGSEQLENSYDLPTGPERLAKSPIGRVCNCVSVAELKHAVEQLTEDERLELAAFIRWRTQKDDPEWQAELADRLDRCLAGRGRKASEVESVHDRLTREGK